MSKKTDFHCVLFLTYFLCFPDLIFSKDDVLDNLLNTVKNVGDYLKIAKEVANLVSQSLGKKTEKQKNLRDERNYVKNENTVTKAHFFTGFFRLLGLDSHKIIAIAVNSVIFLAQLISSLFDLKPKMDTTKSFSTDESLWDSLKLFAQSDNERVKRLVQLSNSPDLPNQLIDRIDGLDSSCVRLLVCKTSPVIWAAQKSLRNQYSHSQNDTPKILSWLPSKGEFEDYSEYCENRYDDCLLFDR